jgi:hypothetical protein
VAWPGKKSFQLTRALVVTASSFLLLKNMVVMRAPLIKIAFIFAMAALPNTGSAEITACRHCVEVPCPKSCTACTVCRDCWDIPLEQCGGKSKPKGVQQKFRVR